MIFKYGAVQNQKEDMTKARKQAKQKETTLPQQTICPKSIKGVDDAGRFYCSHADLTTTQGIHREAFYQANALFWKRGGYNGSNDDEAMIGDEGAVQDGVEGLGFLDRLLATNDLRNVKF